MSNDIMNRRRHVDVEGLEKAQVDVIAAQISGEITKMVDEVALEVNKMLDIYGLEAKMQVVFTPKGLTKQQILKDQDSENKE